MEQDVEHVLHVVKEGAHRVRGRPVTNAPRRFMNNEKNDSPCDCSCRDLPPYESMVGGLDAGSRSSELDRVQAADRRDQEVARVPGEWKIAKRRHLLAPEGSATRY